MTRNERIQKLANAIRAYRGSYNPATGIWSSQPQPARREAILQHLRELRRRSLPNLVANEQVPKDMAAIDGFKTYDEFRNWITKL